MELKSINIKQKQSRDRRILILDDEEEILSMMIEMFENYGYECDGAKDGLQGLNYITNNDYWLIISDVMMPKMSGPEFFRRIQEQGIKCRFIFLTGYEIPETEKHTITKADAVLTKPISLDRIFKTIVELATKKTA